MMIVTMIMTVALRSGDSVFSRTEWYPSAAEKGGNSMFSPANNRAVTHQKSLHELSKKP